MCSQLWAHAGLGFSELLTSIAVLQEEASSVWLGGRGCSKQDKEAEDTGH